MAHSLAFWCWERERDKIQLFAGHGELCNSHRARLFFSSQEEEEEEEEEAAMVGSSSWYNTHYTTYHRQPSTLEYRTYLRTYDW